MTPAQLAKRNRRALLAAERRTQRDLIRVYGLAFSRLTDQIATLQHAITDAQGAGVSTQRLAARKQAATNLLTGMQTEFGQYVLQVTPTITALQRAHAQRAIGDSLDLIRAALGPTRGHPVSIEFRPPSADVVLRLIGNASDGTPLGDLLHEVVSGQVGKARDELAVGIARGDGPREVARRFADVSGETLDRSLVIARTESLRAYRQTSVEAFKVNPAVTGWTWIAALDQRCCPACFAMHGSVHPADEVMATHPSCRCASAPLTSSWAELGFPDIPDNRPQIGTGEEAFVQLSADEQRAVLGPAKLKLYRAGTLRLEDLVRDTHSERWGPGRREATLGEVTAA